MAAFLDLPNEVIYHILAFLYNQCVTDGERAYKIRFEPRLKTLLDVALVSRLLHANVEPFIYQIVNIGYRTSPERQDKRPWNFIRTILERPHLRGYIKTINIQWSTQSNHEGTTKDHELFVAAAQKAGLELAVKSEVNQIRLMSHLLPNVENLVISYPTDIGGDYDPFVLLSNYSLSFSDKAAAAPALSAVGMQNIRNLTIFPRIDVSARRIAPMFLLPNLRSFTAYHVCADRHVDENPAWHGASPLTELRFLDSELDGNSLAMLLRIIRALTHLEYEDSGGRFADVKFCSELFRQALEVARPTLQHLSLKLELAVVGTGESTSIGSLRGFPALRSINCNYDAISGQHFSTVLPRALEVLELRFLWRNCRCFIRLEELLKEKEAMFPKLALVKIYPQGKTWAAGRRHLSKLEEKAKEAGVRVGVATMFEHGPRYEYS